MMSNMSQREKMLGLLVGGAVVVLLNVLVIRFFIGKYQEYHATKLAAEGQLANFKILEGERERSAKYDAWLTANLVPLGDKYVVDKAQQDSLQALGKKNEILITQVARGVPSPNSNYTAFNTAVDCQGKWGQFISFLAELQAPNNFTVVNPLDIKVDPNDKTQFKANITVVKWFAPSPK